MANIQDYIDWRGDLPFSVSSFNDVDALILSQISYLRFDGLLADGDFSSSVELCSLSEKFFSSSDISVRSDTGLLINKLTVPFFYAVAHSERFKSVRITGYTSIIDTKKEEQFAAMSFLFTDGADSDVDATSDRVFVSFRGTDDSIVGWKEDFNLAADDVVPAQKDAAEYLNKAASVLKGTIFVGGHSKGGNLAVYASATAPESVKERIRAVYNNDGPGFSKEKLSSNEFSAVIPKIKSFYPQFSIVGMLFSNAGRYSVVESDQTGVMQHDPFSWHIKGTKFVTLEKFDKASTFFTETFNDWVSELEPKDREMFIDTVFGVIEATDAKTNSEIEANALKNSVKILNAVRKLDPDLRKKCETTLKMFFKAANKRLPRIEKLLRIEKK